MSSKHLDIDTKTSNKEMPMFPLHESESEYGAEDADVPFEDVIDNAGIRLQKNEKSRNESKASTRPRTSASPANSIRKSS